MPLREDVEVRLIDTELRLAVGVLMGDGEEESTGPTVADIAIFVEDDVDLNLQTIWSAQVSGRFKKLCLAPETRTTWMQINR